MFSIDPMIFEMKKYMKQKKNNNKNMINAFSLKFKIGGGGLGLRSTLNFNFKFNSINLPKLNFTCSLKVGVVGGGGRGSSKVQ